MHWTDLQQDLKAVFPKLQLTTEEIQTLIYDITNQTSRTHITCLQFCECFFPDDVPTKRVEVDDSNTRLRRTYGSVTMVSIDQLF